MGVSSIVVTCPRARLHSLMMSLRTDSAAFSRSPLLSPRASRRDLLGLPIQVQPDRDAERRGHLKREAQNGGRDGRPRVTSSSSVSACRRATRPADGTSPTTLPRFPDLLCAQDSAMLMAGSQDVLSPA